MLRRQQQKMQQLPLHQLLLLGTSINQPAANQPATDCLTSSQAGPSWHWWWLQKFQSVTVPQTPTVGITQIRLILKADS